MTKLWCKQHFFNNSPTFLLYQMRERERERDGKFQSGEKLQTVLRIDC